MSRRKEQVRRGAAANGGLEAQLSTRMAGFSRAERAIASYRAVGGREARAWHVHAVDGAGRVG